MNYNNCNVQCEHANTFLSKLTRTFCCVKIYANRKWLYILGNDLEVVIVKYIFTSFKHRSLSIRSSLFLTMICRSSVAGDSFFNHSSVTLLEINPSGSYPIWTISQNEHFIHRCFLYELKTLHPWRLISIFFKTIPAYITSHTFCYLCIRILPHTTFLRVQVHLSLAKWRSY